MLSFFRELLRKKQRSYQRWLDKIIYEMKFWAVLRRKKNPNKYATFWVFFPLFMSKKNLFKELFRIHTEKLHSIKAKKSLKKFGR